MSPLRHRNSPPAVLQWTRAGNTWTAQHKIGTFDIYKEGAYVYEARLWQPRADQAGNLRTEKTEPAKSLVEAKSIAERWVTEARSMKRNPSFTTAGPFELARQHGFTPGSWRERAGGIIEMDVSSARGTFHAWYRGTPRGELFIHDDSSEPVPRWVEHPQAKVGALSRKNPNDAFLAANAEAKIMATLLPEQLWSQASGAGNEWAMWELARRGQTVPWVRTNPHRLPGDPKRTQCDVCKKTAPFDEVRYDGPSGHYACRPCVKKLNDAWRAKWGKKNPLTGALPEVRKKLQQDEDFSNRYGRGARMRRTYGHDVQEWGGEEHEDGLWFPTLDLAQDFAAVVNTNNWGLKKGYVFSTHPVNPSEYRETFGGTQLKAYLRDLTPPGTDILPDDSRGTCPTCSGVGFVKGAHPIDPGMMHCSSCYGSGHKTSRWEAPSKTNPKGTIKHLARQYVRGQPVPVLEEEADRELEAEIRRVEAARRERIYRDKKAKRSRENPQTSSVRVRIYGSRYGKMSDPAPDASWDDVWGGTKTASMASFLETDAGLPDGHRALGEVKRKGPQQVVDPRGRTWLVTLESESFGGDGRGGSSYWSLKRLSTKKNPRQVTGPDACSRCDGTGYAGPHGDTCSRCEGSGVDALQACEGGCGKRVRESQGMCRPCRDAEDEAQGITRDEFGYRILPSRPKARFNPSRLEQWALHRDKPDSPYKPPEAGPLVATGRIYGRPGFPDGKQVVTSAIRSVDGRLLTTVSGSVYSLGEVAPEYASFCARKGIDPLQVAVRNPRLADFVGESRGLRLRDLAVHGSGPMGGYRGDERSRVPSNRFLKPSTRSWPVSDEAHAHIALTFMTRGFGSRSEYPALVRRLAQLWPVGQKPEIWADYAAKKSKIESRCRCAMPTLAELRSA